LTAAVAPIYGAGVVHAVRVPLAQLVAVLAAAMAATVVLLVAASVAPYLLWQVDREWLGPLAVVGAFFLAAVAGGIRLRALLLRLAGVAPGSMPVELPAGVERRDRVRLGAFVRNAMLLLVFTNALAGWAWYALR